MQQQRNENNRPAGQSHTPRPYVEVTHPAWSIHATIYEVNIRQYTPEGTFRAFESHLPRLKEMGIDILWLMPIHPIGQKKRKGSLGSYYSVKDYRTVNPEFGSLADFKDLVDRIHSHGMHVIIDWVANHSAWDNPLTVEHPGWYSKGRQGGFQPTPWYDWDDIIDFDYSQPGLREYMTEAMKYWIRETDIDGFRCDVAGFIPVDFWENLRACLDALKPVFMLAEWESRDLHRKAFDMTYAWSLWDRMKDATTGGKGSGGLDEYIAHHVSAFPPGAYRMTFTENHDKNSWEGGQYRNFGDGLHAAMVLAALVPGMPMVYSGQEAGLDRPLSFFEKDLIAWKEHPNAELFRKLFALKHSNRALWNGAHGGDMERIANDAKDAVISFAREKEGDVVLAAINFSDRALSVRLDTTFHQGDYIGLFSGTPVDLSGDDVLHLPPWGFQVLYRQAAGPSFGHH